MTETEHRISRMRKTYREKKRGGWSKRMGEALSDISAHLLGVSDEQLRHSVAAHHAGKNGGSGGNKRD